MNLFTVNKPPVIKLLIYAVAGITLAFTSTIPVTPLLSPIFLLLSASLLTLCAYHIGIFSLLISFIPFTVVLVFNDLMSAIPFLPVIALSLSLGFLFRSKLRSVEKIICASLVYIAASLIVYALILYLSTGSFDISRIFKAFGEGIEQTVIDISNVLQETTGIALANIGAITDFIKSIMIGTYLAIELASVCFVYCMAVIISKTAKDIKFDKKPLDIRPSTISSVIFLISMFSTLLMNIPSDGIKYYTTLFVNLFFILFPLFLVSGIYYIFKIKFKVERSSPAGLIIAAALSFFFGIFAIAIYFAYSGALYSLRYNKLEKIKDDHHDPK